MEKAIDVKNLAFAYGQTPVFDHLDFSVEKGSFTALIGANGSGKSTLMKLLLGELRATEGSIVLFGEDIKDFELWKRIGYVSQEGLSRKVDFPASVMEVVLSSLYSEIGLFHLPGKREKELALKALDAVGLREYSRRLISELSGGQRQRVLIARALVSKPMLLILDEPSTGMDSDSLSSFYELLYNLNKKEGLTILMVSHDLDRISSYVSDIYCLDYGSVVHLTPEELKKERSHTHVHPMGEHHA